MGSGSGAAMIPILEADAEELKKLEAQIGKVYTAKDLEAARQYSIEQKHLQQSAGDFWNSIAQQAVPALAQLFANTNAESYASKRLREEVAAGRITRDEYNRATENGLSPSNRLVKAYEDEYRAAGQAKDKTDQLSQAQRDAADAAKREADAEDKLYTAIQKNVSAEFAYEQAQIDLRNAQAAVAAGTGNAVEDNLRLREAYVKVADAAVAYAEEQASVAGKTLSASDKADIYRDTLQRLMAQLSPTGSLRKSLQGYIDELNSIPSVKNTTIGYTTHHGPQSGALEFDSGGVVPGPVGAAVPAIVHGGEVVLNQAQQRALASRGSMGKTAPTIIINIDGFYSDGPNIDKLANAIALRLGYATGR